MRAIAMMKSLRECLTRLLPIRLLCRLGTSPVVAIAIAILGASALICLAGPPCQGIAQNAERFVFVLAVFSAACLVPILVALYVPERFARGVRLFLWVTFGGYALYVFHVTFGK